jgi:hypothetical protein
MAHGHTLLSALIAARTELFFAILLLGAAWWVPIAQMTATRAHIPQTQAFDLFLWTLVLMIQSIPYLAAIGLSLISAMPKLPAALFGRWSADKQIPQKP